MDVSHWSSVDLSLLVLRIGIGISFVFAYGWSKIAGGPGTWIDLGKNMALFGITVWPTFWGFMAAATEFVGGMCLMLACSSTLSSGFCWWLCLSPRRATLRRGRARGTPRRWQRCSWRCY